MISNTLDKYDYEQVKSVVSFVTSANKLHLNSVELAIIDEILVQTINKYEKEVKLDIQNLLNTLIQITKYFKLQQSSLRKTNELIIQ